MIEVFATPFVWDVGPEIFRIGSFAVRWYGVLFATGFILGFFVMRHAFIREGKPEADLDALLITMLIATVVGARLGHAFFYEPEYYFSNPGELLKVWRGGLASHGAAIGVLIGVYFYARNRRKQPYLWVVDRLSIAATLAGACIRIGNFFNSEILGVPTNSEWGVVFARIDAVPRHPAQLYESLSYFLIFAGLFWLYRRLGANTPRGLLFGCFLISVFMARFFIEFVKVRQAAYGAEMALSVGQLLSIPAILLGIFFVVRALLKQDKPLRA